MTESQGLQLQIQTIQFTPAVVSFNADQISLILDQQLTKYQGLAFTEDSDAEAKKVIAELRKGKALLETYRKTTKVELTASVTEFEHRIKGLADKFDAVINPLTEQTNRFETDRVAAKRADIEKIISILVTEKMIEPKFAAMIQLIPDHYLNRTTTMKTINAELLAMVNQLKADQDRLAAETEHLRGMVKTMNETLDGGGMLDTTYIRLLGTVTVSEIFARMTEDYNSIKAQAAERKASEERRAIEAQVAQANREAVIKPPHPIAEFSKHMAEEPVRVDPQYDVLDGMETRDYAVTCTPAEHQEIQDFLSDRLYEWRENL